METRSAVLGGLATLVAGAIAFGGFAVANAENQPAPVVTTVAPAPVQEPAVTEPAPVETPVAPVVAEPVAPVLEPVVEVPAPVVVAPAPANISPAPAEIQTFVVVPPAPPAPGTDPNWIPAPRVEPTIAPPLRPIEQQGQ